ncbi:hypothetical protein BASA81_007937 [Batrachochytrium salamandrivorans]|nr:hypothetical protein BASA81_007937 [Batrachochytrium salamandrivorans]
MELSVAGDGGGGEWFYLHDLDGIQDLIEAEGDGEVVELQSRVMDEDGLYLLLWLMDEVGHRIVTVELARNTVYTERGWHTLADCLLHDNCRVTQLAIPCAPPALCKVFNSPICTITGVQVCGAKPNSLPLLGAILQSRQVRSLTVYEEMDPRVFDGFTDLIPSAHLSRLKISLFEETKPQYPYFLAQACAAPYISILNLDGSLLGNNDAMELAKFLPISHISSLSVAFCSIGELGIQALCDQISRDISLVRELDVSFNNIGDNIGAMALARAVLFGKLQVLRARECHIESIGALELATALGSSSLKEVDLSYNQLRDGFVPVLALALQQPTCHIRVLDVRCCALSNQALLYHLPKALLHINCQLDQVHLGKRLDGVSRYIHLTRNLLTVVSAHQVRRLGTASALKRLPKDLARLVGMSLV